MTLVRLDKYLANAGIGTRTEVKNYIRKGQVTVNDVIQKSSDFKIKAEEDCVSCFGKEIRFDKFEYYMFHKPAGCVTATADNVHETVMDYIHSAKKSELFPVGRLDLDTEGLLLITNDGELAHRLLSPRHHVTKTYYALVEGCVDEKDVRNFKEGIDIGDEKPTMEAELVILKQGAVSEILLGIQEGRFHQVKRMFEAVGKKVTYLKRISVGPVTLDENLDKGSYRPLTPQELEMLKHPQTQNMK